MPGTSLSMSAFFGVGVDSGILIVPALILTARMGVYRAVATSPLVITLTGISLAGGIPGLFVARWRTRFLAGVTPQLLLSIATTGTALPISAKRLALGG